MAKPTEFTDRNGRTFLIYGADDSCCPVYQARLQSFLDEERRKAFQNAKEYWEACVRLRKRLEHQEKHAEKSRELMETAQEIWDDAQEANGAGDYTDVRKAKRALASTFDQLVDILRGSVFRCLQRVRPSDV